MLNTHFIQWRVWKCSPVRKETMAEKCCLGEGRVQADELQIGRSRWGGPVSSAALLGHLGRFGGVSIHSGLIHSHYLQRVQGSWGLLVLLTTEAKVAVSTLAFSVSSLSRSSAPLSCGAYFSLVFLLLMISLLNLFCCPSPSLSHSTSFGLCLS